MAEVRTQHSARETTEPITFSEAQNRIKLLFHMPHLFARVIVSSFFLFLSLSLSLKVYFCPIKTNTSRKKYKIALWRSRTDYAKTLIRLCGRACWSESSRDTYMCHIWFVVLWVIFKIRSSCTKHFGVLAFSIFLLRIWFRVGLSFTNKKWLKYFYSNVCKDSCFVLKNIFLFASVQYQNCVLTSYCLRNSVWFQFRIEIVQHRVKV